MVKLQTFTPEQYFLALCATLELDSCFLDQIPVGNSLINYQKVKEAILKALKG